MARPLSRVRLLLVSVVAVFTSAAVSAQVVVSCPLSGTGDQVDRGFYVQNYAGSTLGTVQLAYFTDGTAGTYTISLTARVGAYDGPILGTQTMTANLPAGATTHTFDFGGVPVTPGSTLAFTQVAVSAPGIAFYDVGPCNFGPCTSCPNVFETEDTTPPLSTFRRNSVGLTITQGGATAAIPMLDRRTAAILAASLAVVALLVLRRTV